MWSGRPLQIEIGAGTASGGGGGVTWNPRKLTRSAHVFFKFFVCFHKSIMTSHLLLFSISSQKPFEVSATDATAGTAATRQNMARPLKNPWPLLNN
jgi:hypothetical protein